MKFIITENQLKHIIENDEQQSFFDKLKQNMSILKPVKLTEDMKLKMLQFVVESLNKGDYQVEVDSPELNTLIIYTNKQVLVNGIKSKVRCFIGNLRNTLENKITSNVYLNFMDVHQKSHNDNLGFLNGDNKLFNQLIFISSEIEKELGDKNWKQKMKNLRRNNMKATRPEPKTQNIYIYDDDDDVFPSHHHHNDDELKFGGFGGGSTGGGGAGGSW